MDRFNNPHGPAHTIRAFFQSGFDEVAGRPIGAASIGEAQSAVAARVVEVAVAQGATIKVDY